jgi:hypothetical protein
VQYKPITIREIFDRLSRIENALNLRIDEPSQQLHSELSLLTWAKVLPDSFQCVDIEDLKQRLSRIESQLEGFQRAIEKNNDDHHSQILELGQSLGSSLQIVKETLNRHDHHLTRLDGSVGEVLRRLRLA